jgi:hypothetical protein
MSPATPSARGFKVHQFSHLYHPLYLANCNASNNNYPTLICKPPVVLYVSFRFLEGDVSSICNSWLKIVCLAALYIFCRWKMEKNKKKCYITTKNMYFYDENLNDKFETIIEDRFLWRIFLFCYRSLVTILQPFQSMTKSDIITKKTS